MLEIRSLLVLGSHPHTHTHTHTRLLLSCTSNVSTEASNHSASARKEAVAVKPIVYCMHHSPPTTHFSAFFPHYLFCTKAVNVYTLDLMLVVFCVCVFFMFFVAFYEICLVCSAFKCAFGYRLLWQCLEIGWMEQRRVAAAVATAGAPLHSFRF